jgi:3-oxoacyl-[acyl-carrier protein] reductase
MTDLRERVIVITGASSGIGEAAARRFHRSGAYVVLGARRGQRLKEIAAELGEDRVLWREVDIRFAEDVRGFLAEAASAFGRIDAMVANAGVGVYGGIVDLSDGDVQDLIDVNLTGTVWCVRSVVPYLRRDGGDIVLISSVAGLRGKANEGVYAATKHALVGLAGSLDRELRPCGIRVVTLCPGATATEFAMGRGRTHDMPQLASMMRADDVAEAIAHVITQPRTLRTLVWSMRSIVSDD